jgi:ADP-ribose pyrophosphatase YjhB (NUDIX family)
MERIFSQTFCVVGAIIEKDGKIILVQESDAKRADHGKWNQPAGWLDVGENPLEAVKREVEEETGFNFTPRAILGIYSLVREDLNTPEKGIPHAIKIIFIGDTDFSNPKALHDDVSSTKWFSPEEIEAMNADTLRDADIKKEVSDYFNGLKFSLDILKHTLQSKK